MEEVMSESETKKPPLGVFPRVPFVEIERDMALIKAKRAKVLGRHLWREIDGDMLCEACRLRFRILASDAVVQELRDSRCRTRKLRTAMHVEDVMARWPALIAHMVCESLGYFTPTSAANALRAFIRREPCGCEWYSHQAMCRGCDMFDEKALIEVGRDVVRNAIKTRRTHKGYMADYRQALGIVLREIATGVGPELASWF